MSYVRGHRAINLEPTDHIPHTEYVDHWEFVRHLTGLDPANPSLRDESFRRLHLELDFDFVWNTNDGPIPWEERGRVTDMGHCDYMEDGSDGRPAKPSPFRTVEDVLAFDAVAEYGLPDLEALVAFYEADYRNGQSANPSLVFPGGYYKTVISACIQTFGWEMFLLAVGTDSSAFAKVLDGFLELTLHHYRAWARTSIEVFICHDDMVWTQGPIFHPEWYREQVFPRYERLWSVLKDAGKKVLYCSDGNYTTFVDDIALAGADGFIFEPVTSLEAIARRYGKTHVIIGNADCRILAHGTRDDIRLEVSRCADLGRDCPGYFFAVGNHIPFNVPLDNVLHYFDLCRELGSR